VETLGYVESFGDRSTGTLKGLSQHLIRLGMVLMGGRGLPPERVQLVLGYLEAGLNPMQAARAAGVSKSLVYRLDRNVRGVSRLAVKREAAARRAAAGAAGPGRALPPERVRALLDQLAAGLNPYQAARAAGVSASFAYRLHHTMGGVYRPPGETYCDRYLDREERYELARLRESGLPMRQIAVRMGRSASTISRELARNADPRTGQYQPERADRLAWERQRRPKPSKLARDPVLRGRVQQLVDRRYSPEQVSGRLKVLHPDDPAMRVSHETIYQSIYVYPRGGLKRELQACLRSGRATRRRRGRRELRGKIVDAVPIGQRPPGVEGRLIPGHHEGDLIMGTKASNSAVGTIVERTTGYLTLLPLPGGHGADSVADAIIEQMSDLPPWFTRTLTWDRGTELARHKRITAATGIAVYFADPHSPWQRGTNENTNGLLREYLPKGTDLSIHTAAQLQAIADDLNDRPRKRLGYHTPREEFAKLLAEDQRVATTP
jgi:IS30 family transposase